MNISDNINRRLNINQIGLIYKNLLNLFAYFFDDAFIDWLFLLDLFQYLFVIHVFKLIIYHSLNDGCLWENKNN